MIKSTLMQTHQEKMPLKKKNHSMQNPTMEKEKQYFIIIKKNHKEKNIHMKNIYNKNNNLN